MSEAPRSPGLELDAAPAYELLMLLSVLSDPQEYGSGEADRGPLAGVRAAASSSLLRSIEEFTGGSDKVIPHLVPLAYSCPPPRGVPELVAYLDGLDPFTIYLRLLGYSMRYFRRATPPEVIRAAASGDENAKRELMTTSYPDDVAWQSALHRLLSFDTPAVKARLIDILRATAREIFDPYQREVMPILRRDLETKRLQLGSIGPERLIEVATNGIEYVPEPGITRVLLIPSYAIRPWVHTLDEGDLKIFCYAVAEENISARENAPPPRLVALTKALGDERRLEVLKLLAPRPHTLGEISAHFGVPKTSMHHHLAILRSAGLVRMRSSDRRYSLRPDAVPDVSELLSSYLQLPTTGGSPGAHSPHYNGVERQPDKGDER
ncbi:MAG TPA: metalloregulator ArsR/SmtB family transcription factor [Chloroflexota bacterium]